MHFFNETEVQDYTINLVVFQAHEDVK
uniref:Uncharacterized protein n=1 Tax=Arundo donax TaxID=35708 RepID=A0A0A9CHR1_ARUDO